MVATIIMINEWKGRKQTSRGLEGSLAHYTTVHCYTFIDNLTGISSGTLVHVHLKGSGVVLSGRTYQDTLPLQNKLPMYQHQLICPFK